MNFLVSVMALLLACTSFFAYDLLSFRRNLIGSITTEAQITGANSVSALTFDDREAATATLAALSHSPRILAAAIYDSHGEPFAAYTRAGAAPIQSVPPLGQRQRSAEWSEGGNILMGSRIEFQGQKVGTVYILAETSDIFAHSRNYALISVGILLLCLGFALLFTQTFRRVLARPLIGLAETAQIVTNRKDYSIRAADATDVDEVATLVASFNEMLGQIEARDTALQQAKDELELRVSERTAELTAANRELEAFSYSVAHDLRGPLDAIGNIGFLLEHTPGLPDNSGAQKLIGELQLGTRKMAALIDDLLNLSRSSRVDLHTVRIDMSEMATNILKTLANAEPERRVELVVAPHAKVNADENLMRIVLENLLRNAWKYTSKTSRPRIEFGFFAYGPDCVYFVRDNGAGFDPRLADRLFQPFQRLHSSRDFPGTGIGLATVQRIVARHGGRTWASGQVGQGASFYFTLGQG